MWTETELEEVLERTSSLGWLVLKRFSSAYRPSDIAAAFSTLTKSDFEALRRLHFLLTEEAGQFLEKHVPQFLKAVPSSTTLSFEESRGVPRSRIDWTKTLARRRQLGGDRTHFITRPVERTNESSAAKLMAYLLSRYVSLAERSLRTSIPEIAKLKFEEGVRTAKQHLSALKARGVTAPAKLSGSDIGPLRRSRRTDILGGIRLFDLLVGIVDHASENLFRNILRRSLLAPENHDDLFEVWALLTLIETHLQQGWILSEARLIGGDDAPKRPRFTLEKSGQLAEVFYQAVPAEMGKSSSYKELFEDYDLGASVRRPDITVKVTSEIGIQRTFIEVKRTRDPGYITDSVYKALGYLSDFKESVGPSAPLLILLVWDGIKLTREPPADRPIRIVTANQFGHMPLPY